MIRQISVFISLALCCGCAVANRDAQHLASLVSGDVTAYEKQVDEKVAAEKEFYDYQLETLRKITGGYAKLEKKEDKPQKNETPGEEQVKETSDSWSLLYGNIRGSMERDARLLAGKIITSENPDFMSILIEFISSGVKEEQVMYQQTQEKQYMLTQDLLKNLEKFDTQKDRIKSVRKELTALATDTGFFDQIKEYAEFGKKVQEQIKQAQEKIKQGANKENK